MLALSFILGVLAGAVGLARFWIWRARSPEVAREILKGMYRRTHPNWLKDVESGARVCPCCGWSDAEGLISEEKCTPAARVS